MLSVPLKINTSQHFKKAFSLFCPMNYGTKLLNYNVATVEWEILSQQCINKNIKCIDVLKKSEEVKNVLLWVYWFCLLSFMTPVTIAISE